MDHDMDHDDTHDDTGPPGDAGDVRADVAVVGAGLAGLTAATIAARGGCRVVVLERGTPGGRARSVERYGYVLNQGAHALYLGGPASAVLGELGVSTTGGTPPLKEYRTWWHGRVEPLPLSPPALATTRLLGARSKATAARLFGGLAAAAKSAPDVPFGEWLEHRKVRADLATLVTVAARLSSYSAEPLLAPAPVMLRQLVVASGGVRYVDGGWQAIVDGLRAAATTAGVEVITGAAVTSIERDGDRHGEWIVSAGERTVRAASVVIAAGGPRHAEALIGREPGWSESAGPPTRAACLDVGIDGATGESHLPYLFSADDPLYLSTHGPTAALTPPGHRLVSMLRYLGADEQLDPATARAQLEAHAERAGLPPREHRVVDRYLDDMVVAWGSPRVGVTRPRGDELAGEGVHVAGDWVGDHLLADAAVDSGARAGRALARRLAGAA